MSWIQDICLGSEVDISYTRYRMERATFERFAERLRAEVQAGHTAGIRSERGPEAKVQPSGAQSAQANEAAFVVPAELYRDAARCHAERIKLFDRPRIVAVSASLERGACLPIDAPGKSALVVRGMDGIVRAFANACRHRGTRLVDAPCSAKAFVCPYHAWTYDLTGRLVHVPHADSFAGVDLESRGLVPMPITERDGLVWLGAADGAALDAYLGPIAGDVAALGLGEHVMWQRSRTTRKTNWKLVIEAFLDGYHIRVLHRDSVYRFFLDAAAVAERAGDHIRAITGRRALLEAGELGALSAGELRMLATPSLTLFPGTVFVVHPDFVSIMTVHPVSANETAWDHMMLVPAARAGESEHWNKSWQLIEEGVFQGEDLWVCEQAQHSIDAGAIDELLFGSLESPARWFHEAIERAL